MIVVFLLFFKQKTAYEMRISDWSSDVCSSDLAFLRLFKGMPESGPFPAEKFGRNLETALVESRDTMGVLFTQPEIAMMGQLKGVALNANTVPAITANVNRSGTAIAQRLIDQFGPVGRGAQIAVTRLLDRKSTR